MSRNLYMVAFSSSTHDELRKAYRNYNKTLLVRKLSDVDDEEDGGGYVFETMEKVGDIGKHVEKTCKFDFDIPIVPESKHIYSTGNFLSSIPQDLIVFEKKVKTLTDAYYFFEKQSPDLVGVVKVSSPGPIEEFEDDEYGGFQGDVDRDLRIKPNGWCWVIGGMFQD